MPKIGPLGAPQRGGGNYFEHFSLNTERVHLCKFREDSAQETRVFAQIIAKEKEKEEEEEEKNSSGFETLLRFVKSQCEILREIVNCPTCHKNYVNSSNELPGVAC